MFSEWLGLNRRADNFVGFYRARSLRYWSRALSQCRKWLPSANNTLSSGGSDLLRDTDRDWNAIAESFPYFGVLAHDRFKRPSARDLIEFFDTGQKDITAYLETSRRVFGPLEPKSALDFGCGVGRHLIPLARVTGCATGVDIADAMLLLARKHAEDVGLSVTLTKSIPADRKFDWVNSQIVLQHIPPRRGYAMINQLWRAVAPDGLLTLHITAFRDKTHLGEVVRDFSIIGYDGERAMNYSEDADQTVGMSMYDYELSRVFACMPMMDGCEVFLQKVIHGGCHGFRVFVRKRT